MVCQKGVGKKDTVDRPIVTITRDTIDIFNNTVADHVLKPSNLFAPSVYAYFFKWNCVDVLIDALTTYGLVWLPGNFIGDFFRSIDCTSNWTVYRTYISYPFRAGYLYILY